MHVPFVERSACVATRIALSIEKRHSKCMHSALRGVHVWPLSAGLCAGVPSKGAASKNVRVVNAIKRNVTSGSVPSVPRHPRRCQQNATHCRDEANSSDLHRSPTDPGIQNVTDAAHACMRAGAEKVQHKLGTCASRQARVCARPARSPEAGSGVGDGFSWSTRGVSSAKLRGHAARHKEPQETLQRCTFHPHARVCW